MNYINFIVSLFRSGSEEFNPKAATPSHLCHSLIELLNQISPQFKRNFAMLQKKRSQRHPFERVATPYQLYAWTAPTMEHTLDAIRAEDTFSSKLGYEEHIPRPNQRLERRAANHPRTSQENSA